MTRDTVRAGETVTYYACFWAPASTDTADIPLRLVVFWDDHPTQSDLLSISPEAALEMDHIPYAVQVPGHLAAGEHTLMVMAYSYLATSARGGMTGKLVYNTSILYTHSGWIEMSENTRRINVMFPERLLQELDALVPAGKRSEVIVEATATYLARLKVLAALKATAGAWATADHPELATPEDVNRWLAELRSSWRRVPLFAEGLDG